MGDSTGRLRAEARRQRMILRKTRLLPEEQDLSPLRGEEAISLVTHLSRESWSLAGLEVPQYTRRNIPCRFVSGHLT